MKAKYRRWTSLLLAVILLCAGAVVPVTRVDATGRSVQVQATYLGVANYGMQGTDLAHAGTFGYRFSVGQSEQSYAIAAGGNYELQNRLVRGKGYLLTVEGGTITALTPLESQKVINPACLPAKGTPGVRTIKNLLKTAMMPVGSTLYVYGGGWNWQDDGAGTWARTIGVPSEWWEFYRTNVANYSYRTAAADSFYPYGGFNEYHYAGLDCSGYLGWTLYNTFETSAGRQGYVTKSTTFAKSLSERGWGSFVKSVRATDGTGRVDLRPGDVVSISGHVWLSLGTCTDGSVLIAHSIPSASRAGKKGGGVQLSAIGTSTGCEAYRIADTFMRTRCPGWYGNYAVQLISPDAYFGFGGNYTGRFEWDTSGKNGGLTDPDGMREMTPSQVLKAVLE